MSVSRRVLVAGLFALLAAFSFHSAKAIASTASARHSSHAAMSAKPDDDEKEEKEDDGDEDEDEDEEGESK
jgi:hypothetical protein